MAIKNIKPESTTGRGNGARGEPKSKENEHQAMR